MKKSTTYLVWLALCLLLSFAFAAALVTYNTSQGNSLPTNTYWRMYTEKDGETTFNWFSLISPLQADAYRKEIDTIAYEQTVPYPYGKQFHSGEPTVAMLQSERIVADTIVNGIARKVANKLDFAYDYDGTSAGVRNAAQPAEPSNKPAELTLTMHGTASPEARKHGLEASLMPGHFEPENDTLAKERLDRTSGRVLPKLDSIGIKVVSINLSHEEVQLKDSSEVPSTIANPAVLDSMRYVHVKAHIVREYTVTTPIPLPVLVPLWLYLLGLLILGIHKLFQRKPNTLSPTTPIKKGPAAVRHHDELWIDWNAVWHVVCILLGIAALVALYTHYPNIFRVALIAIGTLLLIRWIWSKNRISVNLTWQEPRIIEWFKVFLWLIWVIIFALCYIFLVITFLFPLWYFIALAIAFLALLLFLLGVLVPLWFEALEEFWIGLILWIIIAIIWILYQIFRPIGLLFQFISWLRTWWPKRTCLEKWLLLILTFIIIFTILSILFGWLVICYFYGLI